MLQIFFSSRLQIMEEKKVLNISVIIATDEIWMNGIQSIVYVKQANALFIFIIVRI